MNYLDKTGLTYVWSKLKPLFNAKQDTLISGTNIKTINNTSVLGSGNIDIINTIYPVGSIYMSVTNTSPSTLFGGTWVQIEDTFLLAAGTNHAAGDTGGEETHTLTTAEMPTHNHTFTGEAHSHGLNSHTHTYDKVKSPTGAASGNTGAASGNTGSTTLTTDQIPAHQHTQYLDYGASSFPQAVGGGTQGSGNNATHSSGTAKTTQTVTVKTSNTGGGQGHTHSLNNHTHSLNSHTHTISTESKNTGAATGNTANATQGGTIGNAGSGNAHNNMPPYLAVYVWKRTA